MKASPSRSRRGASLGLPVHLRLCSTLALSLIAAAGPQAWAQTSPPATAPKAATTLVANLHRYPGADLAVGDKLVREHACAACHVRNVGGDGSAIYRPQGRIKTPAALEAMVEMCNTQLNLGLFPEDVLAVAAVLQRDHYRFAATQP